MNQRLALIDRLTKEIHDDRLRRSAGHWGLPCESCYQQAKFTVDELAPIILADAAKRDEAKPLSVEVEVPVA